MEMIVIIDTNFWLLPYEYGLDLMASMEKIINGSFRLAVVEGTLKELERLSKISGKKRAAKFAMQLVEDFQPEIIESELSADDAIAYHAKQGMIVATQDKALKEKLKQKGIQLIVLRQKKYLQLQGM